MEIYVMHMLVIARFAKKLWQLSESERN